MHGGAYIGVTPDPFPRPLLPQAMNAAGYHTVLIGKHHFVRRKDEDAHMGAPEKTDPQYLEYFRNWNGPYAGFTECFLNSGHTVSGSPSQHYRVWLEEQGIDWKQYFPHEGGTAPDFGSWGIPAELTDSQWCADRTIDIISRDHDRPWFCWTNFQDPHGPFVCPEPWYSKVDTDAMRLFEGYREGEFDDKPEFYSRLYEDTGFWGDKDFNENGIALPATYRVEAYEQHKAECTQATLGMVLHLDYQIGRIAEALERSGQADNTVIVFITDHGEMLGQHGLWAKGATAYDGHQRIPMILWGPGCGIAAQGVQETAAVLTDLPRTFCTLAGTEVPQGMQGVDLTPVLTGEADHVQDGVLVEYRSSREGIHQYTYVTCEYKLVVYKGNETGELYDLRSDPEQHENLWNSPAHSSLKSELMLRLVKNRMQNEGEVHPRVSFA
jgi:arylsulfatase A-like enzyme